MSHLQLRDGELDRIRRNYPDKIPIFITKSMQSKDNIPDIRKKKFLVPSHFTMGEFVCTIRRWLLLSPEQAIFIFINTIIRSKIIFDINRNTFTIKIHNVTP